MKARRRPTCRADCVPFRPISLLPVGLLLASLVLLLAWQRWRASRLATPVTEFSQAGFDLGDGSFSDEARPPIPDDLTLVEGIDERIALLLQASGITTFEELAAADLDDLARLLSDAGLANPDPTTWPEQARMIVAGEWPALTALQNELQARPDIS